MTKRTKIFVFISSIAIVLFTAYIFLCAIGSNLRGPLKNEYLSTTEHSFVDSLNNVCNCDVTIEKDFEVENNNVNNGTVYIEFNYNNSKNNFCLSDSISLLNYSQKIFHIYESILTRKKSYRIIAINYYSSLIGDRSEIPTCDRTFHFEIKTKNYIDYTESNRNLRIKESTQRNNH